MLSYVDTDRTPLNAESLLALSEGGSVSFTTKVKRDYEVYGSGFWVMENIGFLDAMFDRDYRRLESDLKDHI